MYLKDKHFMAKIIYDTKEFTLKYRVITLLKIFSKDVIIDYLILNHCRKRKKTLISFCL